MLNENAKKWVAALRSGEYEQGKKYLCRDNTFCCLGIACEVALKSGVQIEKKELGDGVVGHRKNGGETHHTAGLPEPVREWLGVRYGLGEYGCQCLAAHNDQGKTFSEIASIIESEPEGLFVKEEKQ